MNQQQQPNYTTEYVQSLLEENTELLQACLEFQSCGKTTEAAEYKKKVHQNLSLLAVLADKAMQQKRTEDDTSPHK